MSFPAFFRDSLLPFLVSPFALILLVSFSLSPSPLMHVYQWLIIHFCWVDHSLIYIVEKRRAFETLSREADRNESVLPRIWLNYILGFFYYRGAVLFEALKNVKQNVNGEKKKKENSRWICQFVQSNFKDFWTQFLEVFFIDFQRFFGIQIRSKVVFNEFSLFFDIQIRDKVVFTDF